MKLIDTVLYDNFVLTNRTWYLKWTLKSTMSSQKG